MSSPAQPVYVVQSLGSALLRPFSITDSSSLILARSRCANSGVSWKNEKTHHDARSRFRMHNLWCARYLSGRVEQRLCESGAPVIVHIWVPQGSRVHFSRLCKRLFISASHQIRHCGDANNTGDAQNTGRKWTAVCLLTDYIATQRTLVWYTATSTHTHTLAIAQVSIAAPEMRRTAIARLHNERVVKSRA